MSDHRVFYLEALRLWLKMETEMKMFVDITYLCSVNQQLVLYLEVAVWLGLARHHSNLMYIICQ